MTQHLSVLVHDAKFQESDVNAIKSPGKLYFLVVTNLDDRPVEVTHVWIDSDPKIHVLDNLPVRLESDQQYVTWVAESVIAHISDPYTAWKVFTSRQNVFSSEKNENIPEKGSA